MKRLLSLLVVLVMLVSAVPCSAETEYVPIGISNTQKEYAELISTAIEKSEFKEEQIDKEHIFIIENTSPLSMRKNKETVWLYVALPIKGTSDISFAHFDNGEYVSEITNFTVFKDIQVSYGEKLQQYIENNNLSEPTAITNIWLVERLHLFAYKVLCNNEEFIIPYHFTEDTMFNLMENEDCNIEIGKAYTMDEFLTICEKEAELFSEYRKSENEQDKEDNSYTYVDNDGEVVKTEPEKELEVNEIDNVKDEKEKLGCGVPARTYDFEELTGLAREDIDHIVIRSGIDGVGYSTAYDKVISEIYKTINTKSFNVYMKDGNSGGWRYKILFFDKNNSGPTYTISTGIVVKEKDGLTYRTSNEEELKNVVEKAYNLISNDCGNWASDYIVQAKDLGFLDGVTDVSYKEPVTREKFCEIIYNMLDRNMNIEWKKVSPNPFTDTADEKVISLRLEGIVNGKDDCKFAPDDYLTREEAATIIVRVMNKFMPDITVTETYFNYDDIDEVAEWASDSVQLISNSGIMVGVGENKFSPQDTYTTEQAIASVVRLYNNILLEN